MFAGNVSVYTSPALFNLIFLCGYKHFVFAGTCFGRQMGKKYSI